MTTLISFTVESADSAVECAHVVTVSSQRTILPGDRARCSQDHEDIWRYRERGENERKRSHFFKITIPFSVCEQSNETFTYTAMDACVSSEAHDLGGKGCTSIREKQD